jgi:hypothetical protein
MAGFPSGENNFWTRNSVATVSEKEIAHFGSAQGKRDDTRGTTRRR